MNSFEVNVEKALLQAGWHQGRSIDTTNYIQLVQNESCLWFPEVEQFLAEFGELNINFEDRNGLTNNFDFDVARCIRDFDIRWVSEEYSMRIGKQNLCPLGEAYNSHMLLFVADDNCFYGGFDEFLVFIGSNKYEFIENLCTRTMIEL